MISKKAGKANMLGLITWGSLFAWPPLLLLSFLYEGSEKIIYSIQHFSLMTFASLLYMAYPATLIGFSIWSWMLSQHRAATITPFALLIPFFGMLGSMIVFGEPLQLWKITAAVLIIGGLCINLLGPRMVTRQ